MVFRPNKKFQREYKKIFKQDPFAANTFLLLCELANKNGQVETNEEELVELMTARFNDPEEYAL